MGARAPALLTLIALALALSGPAHADANPGGGAVEAAIIKAREAAAQENCAGVLAALDPIVPALAQGPQRTTVQRMRLVCLGVEGRASDLPPVQRELAETMPRDGLVNAFGVMIAADENRFVDAAEQIAALANTSPRALDVVSGATVRAISTRLAEKHARDARGTMLIALARSDWEPADMPELRVGFAEGAIEALLEQGQATEAEGLLERIDQPELLSAMVIDRRYSRLWPVIEARLGPGSAVAVDRFARDKLAFFADSPESETAVRDAANAMLLLGHHQDVLDLTDGVHVVDGMSRDAVRTILYRARALAAMRRDDDVDRLLGSFTTLDLRAAPAASTALVSYAEFLDEIGRPARALTVARDVRAKAGDVLTELGKRWLDRTEVCALTALGRIAEASNAITALKQRVADNQPAAIEALLCAHRDAEAAQITLKAFGDGETAGELLLQFQPGASLWASAPSRLRNLWVAFLARPDINAAFTRRGRILPRALWPDPQPRAIPRRPADGATLT